MSDGANGNSFPSGLRYGAFGERSATTAGPDHPTDLLFAGAWGYQSELRTATDPGLGLQYLSERYYDPAIGRFLSPDPLGFAVGLNLYRYAGNDPVNRLDPLGLEDDWFARPLEGWEKGFINGMTTVGGILGGLGGGGVGGGIGILGGIEGARWRS